LWEFGSSLNFTDGTQFSATDPTATPLLTVSVPMACSTGGAWDPLWENSGLPLGIRGKGELQEAFSINL